MGRLIKDIQDFTYLKWSHIRTSGGTAGTFLKSESALDGVKKYYKLSNFDPEGGITGHECINELIVDRLLDVLEVPHLSYNLIHAKIDIDGQEYITYLCESEDFKKRGESKAALDDYYRMYSDKNEGKYDFCVRMGWQEYIDAMLAVDYIILNRDRHGANIEVLRNAGKHTIRIAPLFDHGLSLLYSCHDEAFVNAFDVLEDKPCQNFMGGRSCLENLKYIGNRKPFSGKLAAENRKGLFDGLDEVLTPAHMDKIWNMIFERYSLYENI